VAGQWFSPGTLVSSINKTDCHDITEIMLKVVLNTITVTPLTFDHVETNDLEMLFVTVLTKICFLFSLIRNLNKINLWYLCECLY